MMHTSQTATAGYSLDPYLSSGFGEVEMNKSDIIRQIAAENPQLIGKPTAIAKLCLTQKNIVVAAAAVNQALRSKKAAGVVPAVAKATTPAKATRAAKSTAPVKAAKSTAPVKAAKQGAAVKCEQGGSNCAVDVINAAKALLQKAGSAEHAKQVLEALTA